MKSFDVLLTLATLINTGWCLMCYECDTDDVTQCSTVNYECPYATTYFMEDIKTRYFPESKVDYSDPKNIPEPICYTSVSVGDGEKYTYRRCSAVGAKLTCEILRMDSRNQKQELEFCSTCNKDLCNSAKTLTLISTLIIILPAFLLLRNW